MPALARKLAPEPNSRRPSPPNPRSGPKLSLAPPQKSRPEPGAQPRRRTFHASVVVTRVEEWFVEAQSAEEARALLAAGEGHRAASGERVHVEVERLLDGAE